MKFTSRLINEGGVLQCHDFCKAKVLNFNKRSPDNVLIHTEFESVGYQVVKPLFKKWQHKIGEMVAGRASFEFYKMKVIIEAQIAVCASLWGSGSIIIVGIQIRLFR